MRIFVGVDSRQPVAYHVLRHSLEATASKPLDIQPIRYDWCPMKRQGLTEFSFTRYMVPWFCDYEGKALFMDADMLVRSDIHELAALFDSMDDAVAVVKSERRFEWSSLMFFNNEKCRELTPELIEAGTPMDFKWAASVGEFPEQWNHLIGYRPPMPDAKLVHFSMGIPVWPETAKSEFAKEWWDTFKRMNSTVSFQELMGRSVHIPHLSKVAG